MKYIAIDLGLKRIGLAYSAHKDLVTPLDAIIRKNRNQASKEVKNVLDFWEVDAVVIGIPFGGSSENEMKRRVKHFMNLLMKGEIKYIRDGRVDSISAMIILQRYLRSIAILNPTSA